MKLSILMITGILLSGAARAEFTFFCGEGREKGQDGSELALVDSLDSSMKFYRNGKEVPEDKASIRAATGGKWNVTVDKGEGKGSERYEFNQNKNTVQEYSVDDKGTEKKVGSKKKCDFQQKDD